MANLTHLRGAVLSFTGVPDIKSGDGFDYREDAVVTLRAGKIHAVQSYEQYRADGGSEDDLHDVRPGLISAGFVDTHVHYPQMDIIGSFGRQLMDWLDNYAFPAELAYADEAFAQRQAQIFIERLLAAGTTTALTFTTVHAHTTDAFLRAAQAINARMIAGKVLMNRNAPDGLVDEGDGDQANRELLLRWHRQDRLAYAITPRFAITCTPSQLQKAGDLVSEFPDVYVHSHIAEHPDEIAATLALFPEAQDYTDVYAQHGLLTDHAVYAHGIHLSDDELRRFSSHGSAISFCPSSNLFLGSGLLDLPRLDSFGVNMGIGSDVGGGTHLSLLATLGDGYKVSQLNGYSWHPLQAFYSITAGGAKTLHLEDKIGRVAPGYEADLVVLRPQPGSMLEQRVQRTTSIAEQLFAHLFLGADHGVEETYVAGVRQYTRAA